jgi:organic hydroperoxide reductase OsmC/OhrA
MPYSAPIELEGMKDTMTPEDAFVGSANMCYQIVFEYVSRGLGLHLLEYKSRAVGDLEVVDGVKKFVKLVIYPEMRFATGSKMENLQKAVETTKRKCLVTNSMALEVTILPKVL